MHGHPRLLTPCSDSPSATTDLRGLELLQQAGRGGQGVVYRGRLHGLPVAVKVIPVAEGERYSLPCPGLKVTPWTRLNIFCRPL